jgi:hypothetical protein
LRHRASADAQLAEGNGGPRSEGGLISVGRWCASVQRPGSGLSRGLRRSRHERRVLLPASGCLRSVAGVKGHGPTRGAGWRREAGTCGLSTAAHEGHRRGGRGLGIGIDAAISRLVRHGRSALTSRSLHGGREDGHRSLASRSLHGGREDGHRLIRASCGVRRRSAARSSLAPRSLHGGREDGHRSTSTGLTGRARRVHLLRMTVRRAVHARLSRGAASCTHAHNTHAQHESTIAVLRSVVARASGAYHRGAGTAGAGAGAALEAGTETIAAEHRSCRTASAAGRDRKTETTQRRRPVMATTRGKPAARELPQGAAGAGAAREERRTAMMKSSAAAAAERPQRRRSRRSRAAAALARPASRRTHRRSTRRCRRAAPRLPPRCHHSAAAAAAAQMSKID